MAAEAQQKWADLEFRRTTELVAKNSAPRNQLDTAEVQLAQASAAFRWLSAAKRSCASRVMPFSVS